MTPGHNNCNQSVWANVCGRNGILGTLCLQEANETIKHKFSGHKYQHRTGREEEETLPGPTGENCFDLNLRSKPITSKQGFESSERPPAVAIETSLLFNVAAAIVWRLKKSFPAVGAGDQVDTQTQTGWRAEASGLFVCLLVGFFVVVFLGDRSVCVFFFPGSSGF